MNEQEFLNRAVSNCSGCGNKVRPKVVEFKDGNTTLQLPEIDCGYCGNSAGLFCPDEFYKCLFAWKDANG